MSNTEALAIVLDNGSGKIKAGFANEEMPSTVFPCLVGKPRLAIAGLPKLFVGEEAVEKRGILFIKYPCEYGTVTNWDAMVAVWEHTFQKLPANPKEHPVLLTESPTN